jgi:hypothetical protein
MNLIVAIMVMISLQVDLVLFMDIHLLLGFHIVFPLMKAMQSLFIFVSRKDVFICDVIVVIDVYQTQLYTFHCDNNLFFKVKIFGPLMGCCNVTINKSP